jgi:hemolysin D
MSVVDIHETSDTGLTPIDPLRVVTEDSPSLMVWLFPVLVMLLLAVGLAWATVGEVDIVAPEQATLIPSGRVKVIQSPEQRVVRRLLVREGAKVAAGDLLVEFDTDDVSADLARVRGDLVAARLRAARLRASLDERSAFEPPTGTPDWAVADEIRLFEADRAKQDSDIDTVRQERARLEAEIRSSDAAAAKLEAVIPLIRRRVEARRSLVNSQIASRTEFTALEQELVSAESDLRVERSRRGVSEAAVRATEGRELQLVRTHRMELTTALADAEDKVASLSEDLRKAEQRVGSLVLRAPEDGTIVELALHTVGGVVQPAQTLMKLVPAGATLEAEAKVLNRDVGFLQVGQEVMVKLDTFLFTKYGGVPGRVASIASDAVTDEHMGAVFPARIELERQSIEVDGRTVTLTAGMTAKVDICTGKRRVIDYLMSPIRKYTQEAIHER